MKRTLAVALTFAGAAATIAVAASPAQAAPAQCPYRSFCVYNNQHYRNGVWSTPNNDNDWSDNLFSNRSDNVANHDSSWFNNGSAASPSFVRVYDRPGRTGGVTICLAHGTGFESKPASVSDHGESHEWANGC
ncbi:hypothetical protein ACWT_3934 [Actinoplanes sp. SE50]|uniref:peptidase inhibitor family I36 protein n=1 Tax=unclassified Actinoplanes TaxID=2626549 RepID=UPI00023ED254|nr:MULTISPECIES: peptidase inhibitor family I36 protein [unclassified Actinoplanes]AEV84958.1 hypothetical protein ACPL_4063 [Actinoplanes sp. SE50/110]ATO83349.1 hypothetical protein ACWT_3934 [Actinoplanes sp. SE50]SLM00756.1 hypothetical protein ACSP50_3989 [Actinoplanes sp. SE50/110]